MGEFREGHGELASARENFVCLGFKGALRVVVRIMKFTWIRDLARFENQGKPPRERFIGIIFFPR